MRFRQIWEYITETPGNTNFSILKRMVDEYVATLSNALATYDIDADIADSVDLLGKKASDLQKDIFINDGKVYGTLKYVTGYEGFSGDPSEQEGYFLALHFDSDAATTIKLNGFTVDPTDGLIILHMKRKNGNAAVELIGDDDSFIDWISFDGLKYE